MFRSHFYRFFLFLFSLLFAVSGALAQGTSGNVNGTVTDPSGAVVAGATVQIANPVSGYTRTTKSDASGQFQFFNVPFNPYLHEALLDKARPDGVAVCKTQPEGIIIRTQLSTMRMI